MAYMEWVSEVAVPVPHAALSNADWADAWSVEIEQPFSTAKSAGDAIVENFPIWTYPLLALRQIIMFPFGLMGPKDAEKLPVEKIGFFPIVSESQDRVIAGFDDKHLDFRIIVEIEPRDKSQLVRLTTVIRRHNWVGRAYLASILPFHRLIIKLALDKTRKNQM